MYSFRSDEQDSLSYAQFAEQKLGLKLWGKFRTIFELIDHNVTRLLVRSCNGAGKSTALAAICLREITRHENIQIVCTGANAAQLQRTLWASVKRLGRRAQIDMDKFRATSWEPTANRSMIALAPSKVEGGQGFHAERVVVIIDEATSMDGEKITALLSNATGANVLCLFTYNPINPDATVYDLEQSATPLEALLDDDGQISKERIIEHNRTSEWVSIGISAFEHPNVIEGFEVIKGAITRDYVESMLRVDTDTCEWHYPDAIRLDWNKTAWLPTPEALARVCGQWSQSITAGFISGSVVVNSWKVEPTTGMRVAGADIGGGGEDPSMWTAFAGNEQLPFESVKTGELGVVASMIHNYCIANDIDVLGIDDTGVGHGVTDRLNDFQKRYVVIPFHFGSSPYHFPELGIRKPANARCEMYLLLEKEMRSQNIRVLYDKELQRELCCQKILAHKQSETIKIEDKRLIKKRIGRSPNKADATAIARYASRVFEYQSRPKLY